MKRIVFALTCASMLSAHAAKLPEPGSDDPRIRYVSYSRDEVTVVQVQRGTVTRIVLAPEEKILADGSATGFASDCSKSDLEWCVRADRGSNQVFVKPKEGATHNNLELKTNLHDYSFVFRVLPDAPARPLASTGKASIARVPMHRVVFRYPPRLPPLIVTKVPSVSSNPSDMPSTLTQRLAQARPQPKNWRYSIQVGRGSADIAPSLVFDDGRFTYFRFPANREIPTIYAISAQGEESRVNFHIDAADSSLTVVEKMAARFVLRLGSSAVGLWNDAFDANGVPPKDGTTVPGVTRVLREGEKRDQS